MGGGFGPFGSSAWSQTIAGLTIGQDYVISFMTAAEGETPTQQLTVGMTSGSSTAPETFTSLPTNTLFWQNWGSDQYTFLATASSATLQFSVTNQQFDVGLEAVSIAPASVATPEPATLTLLASALFGLPESAPGDAAPTPEGAVYLQVVGAFSSHITRLGGWRRR